MNTSRLLHFHDVVGLRAKAPGTLGAPLVLTLTTSKDGEHVVTIFTGDHAYADRLVAAINGVTAPAPAQVKP